jgi:hypothetical protein
MRKTVLAGLGLTAVLAAPAVAAGSAGPFVGSVAQGQTATHVYDNNASHQACLQVAATYSITLTYTPSSDVLTLGAGGKTATGHGGSASLSVLSGICAHIPITVTGTSVASSATYAVTVTRQVLGPIATS